MVSILITVWNEEVNILNCISSLSALETSIPHEIIVINNNSTDNTQRSSLIA
ncbi:glycosyltransferase [Parapedobacter indicus]|uniref:glycosyltransferase n=1 Tax=Parapedobacter indicus TaxID=1477437 RepID=UPI000B88E22B|nr:glycosyltransferase [Parapedobacter indicus]